MGVEYIKLKPTKKDVEAIKVFSLDKLINQTIVLYIIRLAKEFLEIVDNHLKNKLKMS